MATSVIMPIVNAISSIIAAVVAQVLDIFSISGLIGFHIVYFTSLLLATASSCIGGFSSALTILFGDFVVFLHDVASLIIVCLCFIVMSIGYIAESVVDFIMYVRDCIVDICAVPVILCHWVLSVCENILSIVVNVAEQFKAALTLLGTGIWIAMLFVPYSLFFTADYLACLSVGLINDFYLGMVSNIDLILHGLYNGTLKLMYFFVDIPIQAAAGLVTLALVVCLMYQNQDTVNHLMAGIRTVNSKVVHFFILLVKVPYHQLKQQVYNCRWLRRRTCQNTARDEVLGENTTSSCHDIDVKDVFKLKRRLQKELEEKLCSVCQERRKTVIVLPCRHLCMCEECVLIVERLSRKCPLCRRGIVKSMGVYL